MSSFHTKSGITLGGFARSGLVAMRRSLAETYGITSQQITEAASYSEAMVVRFALGLSATGGRICALVADGLCGWIALATARHLMNAGAEAIVVSMVREYSDEMEHQLSYFRRLGVEPLFWGDRRDTGEITRHFLSCHNIICGLYDIECGNPPQPAELIAALNDIETPVHAIEAPIGIDVDAGSPESQPLYASSTLSLGAPLLGLAPGNAFVGRHYLCDISIPARLYQEYGQSLNPLFSEQPVIQIFPPEGMLNSE